MHLRSKLYANSGDQYGLVRNLSHAILRHEAEEGHRRTIVIGDFNMDPFEEAMLACDGLHALMSRREIAVRRGQRRWGDGDYEMFFNPMWQHFGDQNGRPAGSYYFSKGGLATQYWHMFDQVIIRPALLDGFDDEGVSVIADIPGISLLDLRGRPRFSDHLPLLFRLRF